MHAFAGEGLSMLQGDDGKKDGIFKKVDGEVRHNAQMLMGVTIVCL